MNTNLSTLQKAEETGKFCGITDTQDKKFNGRVQAIGEKTVLIWDRNRNRRVVLSHDEIKTVRCG